MFTRRSTTSKLSHAGEPRGTRATLSFLLLLTALGNAPRRARHRLKSFIHSHTDESIPPLPPFILDMATDASDVLSTSTVTGLVVAGLSLGAVYALNYTRLGKVWGVGDTRSDGHTQGGVASGEKGMGKEGTGGGGGVKRAGAAVGTGAGTSRKGGRRRKGKGKGKSEGEGKVGDEAGDEGEGKGQDGGTGQDSTAVPRIIPGDFEPVSTDVAPASSPAETTAHPLGVPSVKTQKKKKQKQRKHKKQAQTRDEDEGSETGRDVDVARDSTDASRSLSPSVSGDKALPSASRAVPGKATLGASGTRLVPPRAHAPLQPRPSLSFDTDSSWTHVDRRGLKSSKSTDGEGQGRGMDMTSSDVASTPSESPVVERMDSDATDVRGARGEVPRTLAERLVPRPRKRDVEECVLLITFRLAFTHRSCIFS